MRLISLTRGLFAKVDDEDFEFLNQWKWCATKSKTGPYYACRGQYVGSGRTAIVLMHKILMRACGKTFSDHRDGDGLNNQKSNLRPASKSQNGANVGIRKDNKSGLKGVTWHKGGRKWMARIKKNSQGVYLGLFSDRLSAARAYDKAALELFGQFAKTNESMNLI